MADYPPTPVTPTDGAAIAVDDGIKTANGEQDKSTEYAQVKKLFDAYTTAQTFDRPARKQYAIDRKYAAGTADLSWAVSTNLIGSYIDILVSYLYAKDPDVSVSKSEQVDAPPVDKEALIDAEMQAQLQSPLAAQATAEGIPPEAQQAIARQLATQKVEADLAKKAKDDLRRAEEKDAFSQTMKLVISRLWKDGKLKKAVRKQVRSGQSVGPGWFKAIFITDTQNPQTQAALNDSRDNTARIVALQQQIADNTVEDMAVAKAELAQLQQGLQAKVEVISRKGLAIDFCRAEDIQVSLDVADLDDYLDANWIANSIYKPKDELKTLFPDRTDEQIKSATTYYQRKPKDYQYRDDDDVQYAKYQDADQFTTGTQGGGVGSGDEGTSVEFGKIIEIWDRRDNLIKTMIDGVKCWAKECYAPPQASTRFYPFFYLEFFPVDGARHPQSESWRLHKLQNEYDKGRSTVRLVRDRAVPNMLFNSEQVDPANAKKIEKGIEQEWIGLKLTNPNIRFGDVFTPKPSAVVDMALFDMTPVLRDMEKISHVQEAQQSSATANKTATQAEIEQSGFQAGTGAMRDIVEDVLQDFSIYTAEISLQALTIQDVQKIAGPHAFWPADMDINDLLMWLGIDIQAGSTGKPNTAQERQAWATAMPLIADMQMKIQQAYAMGNTSLAEAIIALLRETMSRLGDHMEIDRFIPSAPPAPVMGAMPGLPNPAGGPAATPLAAPPGNSGVAAPPELGPAGGATSNGGRPGILQ